MKQTNVLYGAITGIAIVVFLAALYVTGNSFKPGLGMVAYVIFLAGILLNAINFSKANDANVTFGQVFGSGFRATALILLIVTAWTVLSFYIFPDMKDKFMEFIRQKAIDQASKSGSDNTEAMEKGMGMVADHFVLITVLGTVFYNLIAGLIFSVIGAAVAKKNPQPSFPAQQ